MKNKPLGYINTDSGFINTKDQLKNRLKNMSGEEKKEAVRRLFEFCKEDDGNT